MLNLKNLEDIANPKNCRSLEAATAKKPLYPPTRPTNGSSIALHFFPYCSFERSSLQLYSTPAAVHYPVCRLKSDNTFHSTHFGSSQPCFSGNSKNLDSLTYSSKIERRHLFSPPDPNNYYEEFCPRLNSFDMSHHAEKEGPYPGDDQDKRISPNNVPEVHATTMARSEETDALGRPEENLSSKPCLISVPIVGPNGDLQQVFREVHEYPPGTIKKTVEKTSYLNNIDPTLTLAKQEIPHKKSKRTSRASISSSKSSCSHPRPSPSKHLNDSVNKSFKSSEASIDAIPSWFVNSFNRDRDTFSCISTDNSCLPSETSSNISTMSDLSGYEDEYSAIKRIVSDLPYTQDLAIKSLAENKDPNSLIESLLREQDSKIRELSTLKEDLEIQLHRLSVQLQNSLREKDSLKDELELMQVKLTDMTHKHHYDVLKEKAALEGQLEASNKELQAFLCDKKLVEKKLKDIEGSLSTCREQVKQYSETQNQLRIEIEDLTSANSDLRSQIESLNLKSASHLQDMEKLSSELQKNEAQLSKRNQDLQIFSEKDEKWKIEKEKLTKELIERRKREVVEIEIKLENEDKLSQAYMKLEGLQSTNKWYQDQLTKAQSSQSELQKALSETKGALLSASADADKYKAQIQEVNAKMEENRVQAVKEKSALLSHLEELEADMKEREAMMHQNEENKRNSELLQEERLKRLEEEHKKYQKTRLEMSDVLRQKESLSDDLRHKIFLVRKLEDEAKNLRKDLAMTQESMGEKDVLVSSVSHQLEQYKEKLERSLEASKEKDLQISSLKVQTLKLEASLKSAESNKTIVDETVTKLKEDILRLSTNFYRMKHDLAAKDRQVESLETENARLVKLKQELESEINTFKSQIQEIHRIEVKEEVPRQLTQTEAKLNMKVEENEAEIAKCKTIMESLESEKDALVNSLKIRDSQIEDLMTNLEYFKEKITLRESRLQTIEDKCSSIEKSYYEASIKCSATQKNLEKIEQENEELTLMNKSLKNQTRDLEKNVILERKAKSATERKYEEALAEIENLLEKIKEGEKNRELIQKCKQEHSKPDPKHNKSNVELKKLMDAVRIKDKKIETISSQLDELKKEMNLQKINHEKSIKLKQGEVKKLQDSLARYERQGPRRMVSTTTYSQADRKSTSKSAQRITRSLANPKDIKSKDLECLQLKYNDAVVEISQKSKEISWLNNQISEKIQQLTSLEETKESLSQENERLERRLADFEERVQALVDSKSLLHEELENCQSTLESKTTQCIEWKTKYERLRDSIPEKDTNSPSVGILGEVAESFPAQVESVEDSATNAIAASSTNSKNFDQTMSDLQAQFVLASEALKNKDQLILELSSKIAELEANLESSHNGGGNATLKDTSEISSNAPPSLNLNQPDTTKDAAISSGKPNNPSPQNESVTNNLDKIEISKPDVDLYQPVSKTDAGTLTVEHLSYFKETIKEKDEVIESLNEKVTRIETSFQEKQRRYESNIRLLTRKLKEHMKGRRNSEKQLEVLVQENERKISTEKEQYKGLMTKYLDLEKENQLAHLRLSKCEKKARELASTLQKAEEELRELKKQNLDMQKQLGVLQEFHKLNEKLKAQLTALEDELCSKSLSLSSASDNLRSKDKDAKILKGKNLALQSKIEKLESALKEAKQNTEEVDASAKQKMQEVLERDEKIRSLTQKISESIESEKNLEASASESEARASALTKANQEAQESLCALKQRFGAKEQELSEALSKVEILERQIEISEEKTQACTNEIHQLRTDKEKIEEDFRGSVSSFESQLYCAQAIETSLTEKIDDILKEKLFYQSQMTEFKLALNSALSQIQRLKSSSACIREMSAPSPMDTEALKELVRKSWEPIGSKLPLQSLSERLASIRQEVASLKSQAKTNKVPTSSCMGETEDNPSATLSDSATEAEPTGSNNEECGAVSLEQKDLPPPSEETEKQEERVCEE